MSRTARSPGARAAALAAAALGLAAAGTGCAADEAPRRPPPRRQADGGLLLPPAGGARPRVTGAGARPPAPAPTPPVAAAPSRVASAGAGRAPPAPRPPAPAFPRPDDGPPPVEPGPPPADAAPSPADLGPPPPDAAPRAPGDLGPPPPPPLDLDAVGAWLASVERRLDDRPPPAARRVLRDDLAQLDVDLAGEEGDLRRALAARADARRVALADLAVRAAERDVAERDALLAQHEPPPGVMVIPYDAWRVRYERELAHLVAVQERRLLAERALVEAEHDEALRPLHDRKDAVGRARFRAGVLLARSE